MLQQPLDQFAARIFGGIVGTGGRARQQHLALDVNEQRGGVDEFAGHVHVAGFELVDVGQELRRDLGDGNVVDVDVLLADQVEQQVEGAVVDLAHEDRKRREIGFVVTRLKLDEWLGGGRWRIFWNRSGIGVGDSGEHCWRLDDRGDGVNCGHGRRWRWLCFRSKFGNGFRGWGWFDFLG